MMIIKITSVRVRGPNENERVCRQMDAHLQVLQDVASAALCRVTGTTWPDLIVKAFGSRCYDAAGPKSDWDFALVVPPELADRSRLIRASMRQLIVDREIAKWYDTVDAVATSTLSWTTRGRERMSINVSTNEENAALLLS